MKWIYIVIGIIVFLYLGGVWHEWEERNNIQIIRSGVQP